MNEEQARTILDRVQQEWGISSAQLLLWDREELRDELAHFPVAGVSPSDLQWAVRRARIDPRWAE